MYVRYWFLVWRAGAPFSLCVRNVRQPPFIGPPSDGAIWLRGGVPPGVLAVGGLSVDQIRALLELRDAARNEPGAFR
jgi:hypothetical protein